MSVVGERAEQERLGGEGMRGRCHAPRIHNDPRRPVKADPTPDVVVHLDDCAAPGCDGYLDCVGHKLCAWCAHMIRSGQAEWISSSEDASAYLIHN